MKTPRPIEIILGPPGTGKTSSGLTIVDDFLKKGISPDRIAFISFTRKGAYEARDRAMAKFKLDERSLPYFRTIHSLAFFILKMESREIVTFTDMLQVAKTLGISLTYQKPYEDGIPQYYFTKGDRLFFMENLARTTLKPLKEVWEMFLNDDLEYRELELVAETYKNFKKDNGKYDYTDLIERFVEYRVCPDLELLIVDEVQDLSALQWQMIHILAARSTHTYVAGDDDQAIYAWAGADVKQFIELPGNRRVLSQSYRVPVSVHRIAEKISAQIKLRSPKDYEPTKNLGKVSTYSSLEQISMGIETGTWLLLARNQYMLKFYAEYCINKGYIFESKHDQFIDPGIIPAIVTWESLRKGKSVPAAEVKRMVKFMESRIKIKWGGKKVLDMVADNVEIDFKTLQEKFGIADDEPWFKALNRVPLDVANYIRYALASGEKLTEKPRILISTIHGVKGGEADNVCLMTDMSAKTYHNAHVNMDDEHRVWYVGVTRTRNKLHILQPQTQYFYDMPL